MRVINQEQLKAILSNYTNNPRIVASGNFAAPKVLLSAAAEVIPEFKLHMLNAHDGIPDREGITYETAFVGPAMRRHPRLNYFPARLSMLPVIIREHLRPDLVFLHTSAPRFDTVSLGIEVNVLPMAIETAQAHGGLVIAQANKQMPYTYGDAQIYESEIDYLVEVDEPLLHKEQIPISETAQEIGNRIAALISDNSTLQLGIGAVPDAVLSSLKDRSGMRIWTEMFSDGVLELYKRGVLDKEVLLTASFLFGSLMYAVRFTLALAARPISLWALFTLVAVHHLWHFRRGIPKQMSQPSSPTLAQTSLVFSTLMLLQSRVSLLASENRRMNRLRI